MQGKTSIIFDSLSILQDDAAEADCWARAKAAAHALGASAINAAGSLYASGTIDWGRASMRDAWMTEYIEAGYFAHDPLIGELLNGGRSEIIESGTLKKNQATSKGHYALNHALKDAGYGTLSGSIFGNAGNTTRILVVTCFDHNGGDADQYLSKSEWRLFHALIAAEVQAPIGQGLEDIFPVRQLDPNSRRALTPREYDVLHYLASGMRNDEIAWKLMIAEVTVRKHIISIRHKLDARTREQAIATAVHRGILHI